jgi:hypothetical protein
MFNHQKLDQVTITTDSRIVNEQPFENLYLILIQIFKYN